MEKIKFSQDSRIFSSYSKSLIDKIFKILPLYEEHNDGLSKYVDSLLYELHGLVVVVDNLDMNENFLTLLATLESLSNGIVTFDNEKSVIKREVFKCIDVVKKIGKEAAGSGDK